MERVIGGGEGRGREEGKVRKGRQGVRGERCGGMSEKAAVERMGLPGER